MTFLGKKITGNLKQDVTVDFKNRPEGTRIKFNAGGNSTKIYDKENKMIRVEMTMNNPQVFKVMRKTDISDKESKQFPLRKGICDIN